MSVNSTNPFNYLGSALHRELPYQYGVDARIKKASQTSGALRDRIFSSKDVPGRLKGKVYKSGIPAVLLYGIEPWCLTAEFITRLGNSNSNSNY